MEMDLWHKFAGRPGGRLEDPGVWPGDIPIETHGGLWAFYGALLKSQSGDSGEFHVITASESHDWSVHWQRTPRPRGIASCRPARQRLLPGKLRYQAARLDLAGLGSSCVRSRPPEIR
jgi:hypothetical protein